MISCPCQDICGGCSFRHQTLPDYQAQKFTAFKSVFKDLLGTEVNFAAPIFIPDGTRRRASFAFRSSKGKLVLGFNQRQSSSLVDLKNCPLLTPKINANLPAIRDLISEVCSIPLTAKGKKKLAATHIASGDAWICDADNGLDLVLEFDAELNLGHRMSIFEIAQQIPDLIRVSHRRSPEAPAEPLLEKSKPFIKISDYAVYIPAGTFLQPSTAGEQALTSLVLKYLGTTRGPIADLFCGVGTLSYPLAALDISNKITALDSSVTLLEGFRQSVNKNMIPNIEVQSRNLFKYPLDAKELSKFVALVIDPPRAGAGAQVAELAKALPTSRPSKVIAVSCNPHSFVKDAAVLLSAGYQLVEVTMVDQFAYSNHSELVALFTLNF